MKQTYPHVHLIAKTNLVKDGIEAWLHSIGASNFQPSYEEVGASLTQLTGKRCYMSYEIGLNPNITRVRNDLGAFIDNILSVGHGSTLEHTNYTFAIEGVSRVFTAELNRHRAGVAVSEGSLRYIGFDNINYWIPMSLYPEDNDEPEIVEAKAKSVGIFKKAFKQMEDNYKELQSAWNYSEKVKDFSDKKKLTSLFRRIIGMGVATGGVWTFNLRALRHILALRSSEHAEEEIILVSSMLLHEIIKQEPLIFADFYKEDGYWKCKYNKV